MADQLTWWVGDREPSISDQVTVNDAPVDLSAKTVTFKMRAVGSSTLKVNQPVSFKDALGNWRYDWTAADLDTAGQYLVWIETTTAGKVQTVWETVITVAAHVPVTNSYVELETFKSTAELTGTQFADQDIRNVLISASRAIDAETGQRFYADTDATQVRYYTANGSNTLRIDPLITLTSLVSDDDDDGTFENTWVLNTDFVLEPANALLNGEPYSSIRILSAGTFAWPSYPNRVKVTGRFGWSAPPAPIVTATTMLASRLLKRMREAPFGVAGVGIDGTAVRIVREDPDVAMLIGPYTIRRLIA